jgi:hypothetical protein
VPAAQFGDALVDFRSEVSSDGRSPAYLNNGCQRQAVTMEIDNGLPFFDLLP